MLGLPDLEAGGDIRRIEVAKVDWSDPAAFHCSKSLDLILATDVVCFRSPKTLDGLRIPK